MTFRKQRSNGLQAVAAMGKLADSLAAPYVSLSGGGGGNRRQGVVAISLNELKYLANFHTFPLHIHSAARVRVREYIILNADFPLFSDY